MLESAALISSRINDKCLNLACGSMQRSLTLRRTINYRRIQKVRSSLNWGLGSSSAKGFDYSSLEL